MNPPSGQQPAGTENASFVALVNISESFNYVVPSDQTGLVNQAIQLRLPVVNLGEEKIILGVPSHIPGMMSTDLRELEKKLDEAVDRRLIIKEINFKNGMAVP